MKRARERKPAGGETRVLLQHAIILLVLTLAAGVGWAGNLEFRSQTISVPTRTKAWPSWLMTLFADIDNDGRDDLLAIGPAENMLWIYRQQPNGFGPAPDQTIQLPPGTVWVAPCEVAAQPGVELLISCATGLVYLPQHEGVFLAQPRILATGTQVFSKASVPILIWPDQLKSGTNDVIPVICASEAVLYKRNDAFQWSPAEKLPLWSRRADWTMGQGDWAMGLQPSHTMHLRQSLLANPVESTEHPERKAENDAIRKILQDMARDDGGKPHLEAVDIDGDGQEDLAIWQVVGDLDPKTDLLIFLRGAGHRLPEKPTDVLHCRGFPIPAGIRQQVSPLCDLNGDGICELVLVTVKNSVSSSSSLVEMALSRGLDWTMTIRTWKRGDFSRSPDGFLNLTTMLPGEMGVQPLFLLDGDFNGDGRRDVLARRTASQWDIYASSADRGWFAPGPAATLELPRDGFFEIRDLNHDGLSDLIVRGSNEAKLAIFLSRPAREKARNR